MDEKPSCKYASSVSLRCKLPLAEVPKPIVVVVVFGWITNAPLPLTLPPRAIASVVNVRAKVLAASVEPVVIAEADKVVAAVSDAASL